MPNHPHKRPLVVPYRRQIHVGDHGKDVLAYKRALAHEGLLSWPVRTDEFTVYTKKTVKQFQRAHRLTADGVIGRATYKKLLHCKAFDAYGAKLMQSYHPTAPVRAGIVAAAMFAYHSCGHIYTQDPSGRCQAYYGKIHPPHTWTSADCSGFCLWAAWDAMGEKASEHFGPLDGWTGSMLGYGVNVTRGAARPGDMAYYPNHVAVIVSVSGGNIRVVSYGHAGAPFLEALDYRGDLQEIRSHLP